MLGEHDYFGHAANVYRPSLDIPLLMLRYGYEGVTMEPRSFASQVDIAPTVLQELGLPVPPSWSGVGLQNQKERRFLHFQQGQLIGLLDMGDAKRVWKFWVDVSTEAVYAFDATLDPDEEHNLISEVPSRLRSEWMLELLPASNTIREGALINSGGGVNCTPSPWRFC
jgi:arylsulfatase A-like enzyme